MVFGEYRIAGSKEGGTDFSLGRMFDYQVADMIELGIDSYKAAKDFKVN